MISADELFQEQREIEAQDNLDVFQQHAEQEQLFETQSVPALLHDTTKEDRSNFVAVILEGIESGETNPLNIQCQLKATESMMEMFTDAKKFPNTASRYKKALLEESAKYGKKFEYHNAEFQEKEAGVKYNYQQCNDPEMKQLLIDQERIKQEVDERSKFLKTVPTKGLEIVDTASGEMIRIYPPSKSSTTILQTTLK